MEPFRRAEIDAKARRARSQGPPEGVREAIGNPPVRPHPENGSALDADVCAGTQRTAYVRRATRELQLGAHGDGGRPSGASSSFALLTRGSFARTPRRRAASLARRCCWKSGLVLCTPAQSFFNDARLIAAHSVQRSQVLPPRKDELILFKPCARPTCSHFVYLDVAWWTVLSLPRLPSASVCKASSPESFARRCTFLCTRRTATARPELYTRE